MLEIATIVRSEFCGPVSPNVVISIQNCKESKLLSNLNSVQESYNLFPVGEKNTPLKFLTIKRKTALCENQYISLLS